MKGNKKNRMPQCVDDLNKKLNNKLRENNKPLGVPKSIPSLIEEDITPECFESRKELCDSSVKSIDCDKTRDLGDPICGERTCHGFRLSLHIADISAYDEPCSELEQITLVRGSSYYLSN